MTLQEWTQAVIAELKSAGFEAAEYQGFPMANTPPDAEKYRFLKFRTTLPADRTIYAEGVLFTPAGLKK